MDVLKELMRVRDGDFGPLTNEAGAKLNEICLHLGNVKRELESRGRKLPPELYGEAPEAGSCRSVRSDPIQNVPL